jgi:hypothetical protein
MRRVLVVTLVLLFVPSGVALAAKPKLPKPISTMGPAHEGGRLGFRTRNNKYSHPRYGANPRHIKPRPATLTQRSRL